MALRAGGSQLGIAAAVAIVPLLAAFVAIELRTDRPAVDPRLLLDRPFAAAALGVFGSTVILHGSFILVPLAVEVLLGESATTSGIVLLGLAGVGAIVAPFGGRVSDRRGRRVIVVAGSLVSAAGLALLAIPGAGGVGRDHRRRSSGSWGSGNGLTSPRQAAALESVEPIARRHGRRARTTRPATSAASSARASPARSSGRRYGARGRGRRSRCLRSSALAVAIVSLGLPGRRASGRRGPAAGRPATVPLMSTGPEPGAVQRAGVLGLLGGNRTRLVLTSGTLLFVELLLIRWIPSEVRYIGFFSNFLLMASFLGIGIGLLLGRRRRLDTIAIFPILLRRRRRAHHARSS